MWFPAGSRAATLIEIQRAAARGLTLATASDEQHHSLRRLPLRKIVLEALKGHPWRIDLPARLPRR